MKKPKKYTQHEEMQILRDCLLGTLNILKCQLGVRDTDEELINTLVTRLKEVGTFKYALDVEEKYFTEQPVADWLK